MKNSMKLRKLALATFIFMLMILAISHYNGKGGQKNDSTPHINPPEDLGGKGEIGMQLYPTGSRLPDCSHACGPCFPCKRVMVIFKCSLAESCPIVYRCLCKGKYYHVPSN